MTLRVHALHADTAGCGEYRVILPVSAVNARSNLDIYATTSDSLPADATRTQTNIRIRTVTPPPNTDVLVIQRPVKAEIVAMIEWLREKRPEIAIVVELDDDIAGIPTNNVGHKYLSPKSSPQENYSWMRRAIASADLLTVSTPELARLYGTRGVETRVIRNAVPYAMTEQPARTLSRGRRKVGDADENRIIGWAGYAGTHAGDLEVMSGALADVVGADRTDGRSVSFRNIGPGDNLAEPLGLSSSDVGATGWLSTDLYRVGLGQLDLGIVPLIDSRFNRCKSALKALEMSAAAVPVVASSSPEHVELRNSGLPIWLVKSRRRDWVRALRAILDYDDAELRDMGRAARQHVKLNHTIEMRADEWADAWRAAANLGAARRSSRSVAS